MSGFHNADITKGLVVTLALTSLAASLSDIKPYLHLQIYPHISQYRQLWRVLLHPLAFANSTELVVGIAVISTAGKNVERAFGTRKYASFLLLSSFISTCVCVLALLLGYRFGLRYVPAGPYGVIFSILWQHHILTPTLYTFRLCGIELSPKVLHYIIPLQLLLSDPPPSLLASLSGLLAGHLYTLDPLSLPPTPLSRRRHLQPLGQYRFPRALHTLLSRALFPVIGTTQGPRRAHRSIPGQTSDAQAAMGGMMSRLGLVQAAVQAQAREQEVAAQRAARRGGDRAEEGTRPRRRGSTRGVGEDRVRDESAGGERGQSGLVQEPEQAQPGVVQTPRRGPAAARAAVGEWVSEIAGRSARAPTEEEIAALTSMFPNMSRERVLSALQRSDNNTAQAVEALLEESS